MPDCSVIQKSWSELTTLELYSFLKLRTELDNRDQEPTTEHVWIADDAGTAAYLRVIVDSEPAYRDARRLFGRVVVRKDRRGERLAQALIQHVLGAHGGEALLLHSQEYIAGLYSKFGFEVFGDSYMEAGLPHVMMYRAGR